MAQGKTKKGLKSTTTNKAKAFNFKFRFIKVELLSYRLDVPESLLEINLDQIKFSINLTQQKTVDGSQVLVIIKVVFNYSSEDGDIELGEISVRNYFDIRAKQEVDIKIADLAKEKLIIIPMDKVGLFADLAFDTLRGIMWGKFIGTPLEGLLLPVFSFKNEHFLPPAKS